MKTGAATYDRRAWTWADTRRSAGLLRPYGRPYSKWLGLGGLATLGLVLLRLGQPWPLRGVIELVFPMHRHDAGAVLALVPAAGDPVLWLLAAYVLATFGVGAAEMAQRVSMAKFATHTVHDLRAAAVRGATARGGADRDALGDLIARTVGDSARIRESLKGILIHISQSGLFYLGVCTIFLAISPRLACFFVIGGLGTVWISLRAMARVAEVFGKQRRKESAYATALHRALDTPGAAPPGSKLNQSSARKDVKVTRIITRSSLWVHVLLGSTTGVALWLGVDEVRAGLLAPGDVFLFVSYALMIHQRVVQVGRQTARAGKVLVCVDRIGGLIEVPGAAGAPAGHGAAARGPRPEAPAGVAVRVAGVVLCPAGPPDDPAARSGVDLVFEAGTRAAVVGPPGAGKSTLLAAIARAASADKVGTARENPAASDHDAAVAWLPPEPALLRAPLWRLLGLQAAAPTDEEFDTLRRIGVWKAVEATPERLLAEVDPASLSPKQVRVLALAAILLGGAGLWVLDEPLAEASRKRASRRLDEILARAGRRTVLASLSPDDAAGAMCFDRVIVLARGRIDFDGPAAEWESRGRPGAPASGARDDERRTAQGDA